MGSNDLARSIRISVHKIRGLLDHLNEVYFLLEQDKSILDAASRKNTFDPEMAKESIAKIIYEIETNWEDLGIDRLDTLVMEMREAVENIKGLNIEVSVTKTKDC